MKRPSDSTDPLRRLQATATLSEPLRKSSRVCATLAAAIGALVLAGWIFHTRLLMQILPGQVAMAPNAALGFLLSGLALWLRAGRAGGSPMLASRAAAALAGLLGLLSLAEYASGRSLGIDEALFRDTAGLTSVFPGRMAVLTALSFVALSAALLTLDLHRAPWASDGFAFLPGILGMASLTDYAFGGSSLYWIGFYKGMAIHTALAFLVLAAGVLLVHAGGLSRLLVSDTAGGVVTRRILPVALLAPFILGWLRAIGQQGRLYGPEMGRALYTVFEAVILTVILLGTGAALIRADEKRRSSEETLRKLSRAVEQSPVSVVITDTDGDIEYVNPGFTQATGYSSGEVLGMNPRILKSGEQPPEVYRELWEAITAGREWRGEFHNRKKDGDLFWEFASISPILDERQRITHFVAVKEDITQRKRAEETLAARERHFRSLIENALDVIAIVAPDGAIRYVSPSVERLLGYDPTRAGNLNAFDVIHPGDLGQARARFQETLETGTRFEQFELRVRHANGSWRTLSMIGKPSPPETGTRGLIINARDVTENRAVEDQLRQAQKMEAVGRLAGGIAHDFNNLLTAILGYTELATGRLKPEDPSLIELHEIDKAARRAADLTRQLLAFSRKQVLRPRVIDLNQVVSDTDKILRRLIGEDIELVALLKEPLGSVRADPSQVEQVLLNLAVNSRDAMPKGGKLTIETSEVELDEAYSAFRFDVPPGRYVLLAVSDTGSGMDASTLSHVFEPFFTTKEAGKGTGLGLSTVYGVIRQSGGHVTVYSEPGVGTTFKIYLPRVEDAPEMDRRSSVHAALAGGTETVLVVEDEEAVRRLTCRALEAQGYTVLPAASAREAILLCEKHAGEIHLMLTDVVMPHESGRELAQRAAALRPRMKVLFMSGYTDNAIVHHGVLDPGTPFLQKPFTPQSLARKVREVLDADATAGG